MKAMWTRLAGMVRRQGGDTRFMEPRFERLFLSHHNNADELIVAKDGTPLAAVYFTPAGRHPGDLRRLMNALRKGTSMSNEANQDG